MIAELLAELGYPASDEVVRGRLDALGPDDLVMLADEGAGLVAVHRIPLLAEGGALARITALVVRPEMRGRGAARALLDAAEEAARHWGCRLIEVSSGRRAELAAAHRLYRAAGFTDTSPQSVRYWKVTTTAADGTNALTGEDSAPLVQRASGTAHAGDA